MTNFVFDIMPYLEPGIDIIHAHLHGNVVTVRNKKRCNGCGHRLTVNGIRPVQTRELPPTEWPKELIDRYRAKRLR